MKKLLTLLLVIYVFVKGATAQHEHHAMTDSSHKAMPKQAMQHETIPMSHAFSLNVPMNRNGSGTGWLPDASPMYGYMLHGKKWMYMLHGNVFLRYTRSDLFNKGTRGAEKFDAVNWFMGMGQRKVGERGLFRFSAMVSLDNVFGGDGYPLLFQTGETWNNKPLVDRQHPHDLFSELSIGYTHSINKKTDVFIYAGYPGEPALGSVAFMHRVSSLYGPDAPLSHHWNDGTHITFGVVTAGVRYGRFKLEASSFTGREPDENRNNFDKPRFDSYSGRISFNPNENWALQVSQGHIKSPEILNPSENVDRTTASVIYSKSLSKEKFINATALWGLNKSHGSENAALLEAAFVVKRFSTFGRYEFVEKSTEELDLDENQFGHDAKFPVNAFTLGASYDVLNSKSIRIALGAQASIYAADKRLDEVYGKRPMSGQVFLRVYPPKM